MMKLLLQKEYAMKYIHKKAPSQILIWVLNTLLPFEDSLFKRFYLFKVFYIIRPLKSAVSLKYFTSFNSSNMLLNPFNDEPI